MEIINDDYEWIVEETKGVDLGDERLNKRLKNLLKQLGDKPSGSIPCACNGWGEIRAAYRFFDNDLVTAEKILQPHYHATIQRIKKAKVVLLPQDTSELNYSGKSDIEGLGPLSSEEHYGMCLHSMIAVTPDRVCLGVVEAQMWARKELGEKGKRRLKKTEDKESHKWLKGFKIAEEIAREAPDSLIVSMADREGDMYEYFLETGGVRNSPGAHWIIRSCQNRCVDNVKHGDNQKLWEVAKKAKVISNIVFNMPAGRKRKTRAVEQEVRMAEITLKGLRKLAEKRNLPAIKINVVLATEPHPPKGEKPIEWLLLTSLPLSGAKDALDVVKWYLCRWQVEIFFKVLKSGCKIEKLQLETRERLEACLALYMIIAWRVLFITAIGRYQPDLPCNILFHDSEWKSVWVMFYKKPPPEIVPKLEDMIRMIASFGGYTNRKSDSPPGPQTMWLGLQRMRDFALAWQAFHNMENTYG